MKAKELVKELKGQQPPVVVDVRSSFEFRAGHIPGALNLPVASVVFRCGGLLRDKTARIVLTCEHGPRAVLAKSLLGLRGYSNIELLDGHMHGYRNQKLPLEK